MFQKNLGEDSVPLYTPTLTPTIPYPSYTPSTLFIPGSAYERDVPNTTGIYGKVIQSNVSEEDRYISNDDEHMEGMSMFAGDVGAEDFGPPAPTTTQVAVQSTRDILTSSIPLTQTSLLYMVGGALGIYLLYKYWYLASEA